ncbi:type VII secretion-associated serine protease mycosin [Amycolatopsis samaneae]|uniref:Type VII secretion-associated serine protease mycosin n=1 Tax=Amycolatopsis samaneae TaxID=664691 RepID=A0ABW5GRB1_9PSEU
MNAFGTVTRSLVVVTVVLAAQAAGPAAMADRGTAPPLPSGPTTCLSPPSVSEPEVPWGQRQLAPDRVWHLSRGKGITVAVVDTGVDAGTPQLAGRVLTGTDVLDPHGKANTDCYGHGTFVAGIIGAAPDPGTGFAGVAPDVTILPIRAATGQNNPTGALADGIRAAVDRQARIINVSASTSAPSPELRAAIDYAAARGVLVVASAANGAKEGDPVTYPAAYPSVLAVGAIDSSGARADFSQTGGYLGLVAPGVDVISIGPGGPGQWQSSGTSYSAPFVTGVAALVLAYHPGLSGEQLRHRLEATADHPPARLPDPGLGWGTVNPMAAVTTVLPEEEAQGAQGGMVTPPPVRPPAPPRHDDLAIGIVVAGLFVVAGFAFAVRLAWRLVPAGRRRRWRPARVAWHGSGERDG